MTWNDGSDPAANLGQNSTVRAIILAVSALETIISPPKEYRNVPTAQIFRALEAFLLRWRSAHPDPNDSSYTLTFEEDEDLESINLKSYLFSGSVKIPLYNVSDEIPATFYVEEFVLPAWACWVKSEETLFAGQGSVLLPPAEDFAEVIRLVVGTRMVERAAALNWAVSSDVYFGASSSGTPSFSVYLNELAELAAELKQKSISVPKDASLLTQISTELIRFTASAQASRRVFDDTDGVAFDHGVEQTLADGVNRAVLPETRVLAAEHLSYMRNRRARAVKTYDAQINNYVEACRLAHFAYRAQGRPRYAKYMAQNLLDLAGLIGSQRLQITAEVLWIDAYLLPYWLGFTSISGTSFPATGWSKTVAVCLRF